MPKALMRYNYARMQKRADAVRRYLAEHYNVPLFRMHVLGLEQLAL
jgi:hypothetical protein